MKRKIAVITENYNDIIHVLEENGLNLTIFKPGFISAENFNEYECICILGGSSDEPMLLGARERTLVEEQLRKGKKVFAEYCSSIGNVYCEPPRNTRYERLVFCSKDVHIDEVDYGDIIDDQCGSRIRPYAVAVRSKSSILQYANIHCHKKLQEEETEKVCSKAQDKALWFEEENLMICSFRLCNFIKARYSPMFKIKAVVQYILRWLTEEEIKLSKESYYLVKGNNINLSFEEELRNCIKNAVSWFKEADILINDGKDGVKEGMATEIYPDGSQRAFKLVRTDCCGEVSFAYFMDYLLNGNRDSLKISDNLSKFCFDYMLLRGENYLNGMLRWSNEAWEVCYQDDAARAIIPYMLKCLYTGKRDYLNECTAALDFLVRTTGTDGTRVYRTDNIDLSEEKIQELNNACTNFPSAHYNAYYHAALLIGYKLTGIYKFKDTAVRGLTTIMKAYPETNREQSQTEEYCRLIFPLSWLYFITKEEKHKKWLYKVTEDLQNFKHVSGAYLEYDDGYKAAMRNTKGDGECSLLSQNGDTIADLLYSNNWLPLGFMHAYLITEDNYFKRLWKETAEFMIASQIQSRDKNINGAWARGFDVEYMEYFGCPADIGWGPWAMESGWTVAEITSGLIMGLVEDKIKEFYK